MMEARLNLNCTLLYLQSLAKVGYVEIVYCLCFLSYAYPNCTHRFGSSPNHHDSC